MGMPGSETALEELLCRILGDCLEDGIAAKLADDLYCGADSPEELLINWKRILDALQKCNIKLSPSKTIICPRSTTILGWIWTQGCLSANTELLQCHRVRLPIRRYQADIQHFAGSANVPSDFASRNAPGCNVPKCQICNFISTTEDFAVRSTSIQDVHHLPRLPFTTRSAWIQIQSECPDLRRTNAHLKQRTRPSKKLTNVKDVKRYLNSLSIAKDGILVVRKTDPLSPSTELIVVPRSVLDDVLKRCKQAIIVVGETTTSFTATSIIHDEKANTLRDALAKLCSELHPLEGPPAIIRVDPAPGFVALRTDPTLKRLGLSLEIAHVKNTNKNPVAEKAIAELEEEILRQAPNGGPISTVTLAIATSRLNSRLRREGLSARKLWTQRDQFTHDQLHICDRKVIQEQHLQRKKNHPYSEKSKNRNRNGSASPTINIGDLVCLVAERDKTQPRSRYLVISVEDPWCVIKKFS
ncbi:Retrovirus-related Pol poly from transposon opus, partial [Paramuricea clavata]